MSAAPPVLLITDRRFWRRSIGSEQRIASLLEHLARRREPLAVAYLGRLARGERAALARFLAPLPGVAFHARRPDPLGWLAHRLGPRAPRPANPLLAQSHPARRRFVQRLLRALEPRAVIVEFTRLTPTVHPRPTGVRHPAAYLIDTHDLLHQRAERARAEGAAALAVDAAEEAAALAGYDAILAIQAKEARALQALLPDKPVLVVPHGLALPCPVPGFAPGPRPIRLGLLGGRDPSNAAGLHWFLDEVWPKLGERVGGQVELVVAGQLAARWTREEHGMRRTGPVASIDAFWPTIDVAINPVRFGSGLKIKNVEAMAWGRALLTTPLGAEGLEDAAPAGLRIAATAADWAAQLVAWLEDPAEIERVGRAARRHAERHFAPTAAFAALDAHLDALADARAPGRGSA